MRQAKVYTKHLNFETRQHKLGSLDLGDGVARPVFVLGLVGYGVWLPTVFVLFGTPTNGFGFALYLLPPMFLSMWGAVENGKQTRRKNVTAFGVWLGFLFFSKPTTNLSRSKSLHKLSFSQKQNKTPYKHVSPKVVRIHQKPRVYGNKINKN